MGNRDQLYELVHTLNRSEKRYFKIFAAKESRGESSKYLHLFEAIARIKPYDEAQLQKLYAQKKWQPHVSRVKNYLSHLILKSLYAFRLENNTEQKIWELIGQFHILRLKGLWRHAAKILAKAEKMSEKLEHFPIQLELCMCHNEMLRRESDYDKLQEVMAVTTDKVNNLQSQFSAELKYTFLSLQVHLLHKQFGPARGPEHKAKLQELYADPLLQEEERAITTRSRFHFHSLRASAAITQGDYALASDAEGKLFELLRSYPKVLDSRPHHQAASLRNLLLLLCYQEKYAEGLVRLGQLLEVNHTHFGRVPSRKSSGQFFANVSCALIFYAGIGQVAEGTKLLKATTPVWEEFGERAQPYFAVSYLYGAGLLCFTAGDIEQARFWLGEMIRKCENGVRQDLQGIAKLLLLLIQLQVDDFDAVEMDYPNTMRTLRKTGFLQTLERYTLQWIKLRLKWGTRTPAYVEALKALSTEAVESLNHAKEKPVLLLFDFRYYLQAELDRMPFWEALQAKVNPDQDR